MTININIHAAEWEFKEELPFNITTVNDEVKDFELPLFDDDDNETERILLKDCRVIELIGEDDSFIVVIENCELARYALVSSVSIKEDYQKAISVIASIDRQL